MIVISKNYKSLIYLVLYIFSFLYSYHAYAAQEAIKDITKATTTTPTLQSKQIKSPSIQKEEDIMQIIAKTIKPTIPDKKEVDINYGFSPPNPVNLNEGSLSNTNLNIRIDNPTKRDIPASEIMNEAYNSALAGHYESAILLFKKALILEPNNIDILYSLGIMYHKLKQLSEAKYYYKEVLKVNPTQQKALHNFLAVLAEESPQEGLKELLQLKNVNPNYSPVLAQIGMVYAKQGDYSKAENYLRKAIIFSPQEALYKYNLAVMYDKHKKYKLAIKLYQEVIQAGDNGKELPQSIKIIKQRVNFLMSKQQ